MFGGFKQSGLGRELGPDALDSFTDVKNVFISTEDNDMAAGTPRLKERPLSSRADAAASASPPPAGSPRRARTSSSATSSTTSGPGLAEEIGGTYVHVDVTDADEVEALFAAANAAADGSVDIAFNNAGISPPDDDSILDTGIEAWRRVQEVNLTSVYLCCKAALPYMREQQHGSIINTASFVAVMGAATSQISYTASKGGVLAMSRELGVQFAREGIRVNALCPGPVNTPLLRELFAKDPERARDAWSTSPPAGSPRPRRSPTRCSSSPATSPASSTPRRSSSTAASPAPTSRRCETAMSRPVIGITSYVEPASWGAWTSVRAASSRTPMSSTSGLPAPSPSSSRRSATTRPRTMRAHLLSRLDGLVLAGGADVESSTLRPAAARARAGAAAAIATQASCCSPRSSAMLLPVLGVCRGMQVMVVAAGGELEQHLPDRLGHLDHGPAPATYGPQLVEPVAGQPAARAARRPGRGQLLPPSGHRDAPDVRGRGAQRRRRRRGDRVIRDVAFHARRAVASGDRLGRPAVRGSRRAVSILSQRWRGYGWSGSGLGRVVARGSRHRPSG